MEIDANLRMPTSQIPNSIEFLILSAIFASYDGALTLARLKFIVCLISHSRFITFDNTFMIDFICVRKYFSHREYGMRKTLLWQLSPRRAVFDAKRKQPAFETIATRPAHLDDEDADDVLPTDGKSTRVGGLLALLSALISLSTAYLAFVWLPRL